MFLLNRSNHLSYVPIFADIKKSDYGSLKVIIFEKEDATITAGENDKKPVLIFTGSNSLIGRQLGLHQHLHA